MQCHISPCFLLVAQLVDHLHPAIFLMPGNRIQISINFEDYTCRKFHLHLYAFEYYMGCHFLLTSQVLGWSSLNTSKLSAVTGDCVEGSTMTLHAFVILPSSSACPAFSYLTALTVSSMGVVPLYFLRSNLLSGKRFLKSVSNCCNRRSHFPEWKRLMLSFITTAIDKDFPIRRNIAGNIAQRRSIRFERICILWQRTEKHYARSDRAVQVTELNPCWE